MLMYSLQDFNKISYHGFEVTLPEDVVKEINELVKKVGSPSYIKTPVFQKIGRNDKCPCKSGKKYKHCCGAI